MVLTIGRTMVDPEYAIGPLEVEFPANLALRVTQMAAIARQNGAVTL
jgi:hypothetical protein